MLYRYQISRLITSWDAYNPYGVIIRTGLCSRSQTKLNKANNVLLTHTLFRLNDNLMLFFDQNGSRGVLKGGRSKLLLQRLLKQKGTDETTKQYDGKKNLKNERGEKQNGKNPTCKFCFNANFFPRIEIKR